MIGARLLAGKGLIYVGAALAALLAASNLGWWVHASGLRASLREARADVRVAETERAAWRAKAEELATANRAGQGVLAALRAELDLARGEARRLDEQARSALAAARADAEAAERSLQAFRARYQRQRAEPGCAGALAAVQQQCPEFGGY